MEKEGYVAIRQNELGKWVDSLTFAMLAEVVEQKIKETDEQIPWYTKVNPVVGIVKAKILVDDKEF